LKEATRKWSYSSSRN